MLAHVIRMDWFSRSGREKRRDNGWGLGGGWGEGETGQDARLTCQHVLIGVVRDREDVGRGLAPLLAPVGSHHFSIVHWQPLIGVDRDAEEARVGLGVRKRKHVRVIFRIRERPPERKKAKGELRMCAAEPFQCYS